MILIAFIFYMTCLRSSRQAIPLLLTSLTLPLLVAQAQPGPATFARTVVADVNHDGRPDLVVAEYSAGQVSVVLGDGGAVTGSGFRFPIPHALAVAAADFDGDGNPDLAVSSYDEGTVSILLGDGSGRFVKPSWGDLRVGGPRSLSKPRTWMATAGRISRYPTSPMAR